MNIYNAIMSAADHIERNPQEFSFMSTVTPRYPGCGTPGCAMGWIGAFAGRAGFFSAVADLLQLPKEPLWYAFDPDWHEQSFAFYNRMDALAGTEKWRLDAASCARALRLYAAKYHAKPALRTDSELVAALLANIKVPVSEAEELTW